MTRIFELYENDKESFENKLKEMSVSELLSNLDDTIQVDMLQMSNDKWAMYNGKKVYQAIICELKQR